ncbi:hypothetical protein ABXN37_19655 [Piscinibacter sakaiensis]|uniref:Uncharacterized protein n=1 Tax=Piscinibacter sakaiensis TaxID=1547922 RepID=A0A0K8P3X1_PISS1|nr:hypothetical protein [Piscinibacter sakaiensis]GAP37343.1 hypothetical protein ISF6_3198 [Piscinibacter sakaiensis]
MEPHHIAYVAQIAASLARVAGMQAENQRRAAVGQSPAYVESDFKNEADNLEHIAAAARLG